MGRPKIEGICSVPDCGKALKTKGMCQYHYNKQRLIYDPSKGKSGLRGHPFYHLWFERKQNNLLCETWLDFKVFITEVSPKPDGNFCFFK